MEPQNAAIALSSRAKQHLALSSPRRAGGHEAWSAAYREQGQGVPLLLLHGFLGDGGCWQPLMAQLEHQFHCIALDLLGFGESAKPQMRYDIATEVAFVRAVVVALDLAPCYILGHSFGGWVAAAYALAYPEAVKGLVLAAAAGIRDDSFCGRYDHLRPLLWRSPLVDGLLSLATPLATLLGQRPTLKQLRWFRRELMAQPAARSFLMDRLRPEDAVDTVEAEIHRLRVPTVVVIGERDDTIPRWHAQTYAQEIPGAHLVILPNADHALPQNHAGQLANLTLELAANCSNSSHQG
ncbi:alpha/beta fold hydrolase [Neosynechococcus sphagnicola]|uniref:alpha/beta fold hydrolase n=1 Tax=Neosynechococcus sphagnicola TaxID=1501145 RepID=UPI00068920C9|nr:alpha/beta hydrolase [Neosynechococcus sphagnicola]